MSCSSSGLVTQISQVSDQADLCHTPWLFMSSEFLVHFEGIHKQTLSILQTEQRLHSCGLLVLLSSHENF